LTRKLQRGRWELLSPDTAADGGPGARSCHKICLDQQNGVIYVFGGYVDPEQRGVQPLPSDFYAYHIDTNSWECLRYAPSRARRTKARQTAQRWATGRLAVRRHSADASLENGPTLIYDHEMCFHSERNTIYIFGGRCGARRSARCEAGAMELTWPKHQRGFVLRVRQVGHDAVKERHRGRVQRLVLVPRAHPRLAVHSLGRIAAGLVPQGAPCIFL